MRKDDMSTHDNTHYPDQSLTISSQARALDRAPSSWYPPAPNTAPVRATSAGRDAVAVIAALSVLLCGMALVAIVQRFDQVLGADTLRIQVCNRFDFSPITARCTGSDPFIVVRHGVTGAYLQVSTSADASGLPVPVTISVTETNGAGLVLARGSTRWVLPRSGSGVAVVAMQDVFSASGIPLAGATLESHGWESDTYSVQVRTGATVLGDSIFHVAL
jgi:hypothetical protein